MFKFIVAILMWQYIPAVKTAFLPKKILIAVFDAQYEQK